MPRVACAASAASRSGAVLPSAANGSRSKDERGALGKVATRRRSPAERGWRSTTRPGLSRRCLCRPGRGRPGPSTAPRLPAWTPWPSGAPSSSANAHPRPPGWRSPGHPSSGSGDRRRHWKVPPRPRCRRPGGVRRSRSGGSPRARHRAGAGPRWRTGPPAWPMSGGRSGPPRRRARSRAERLVLHS